MSRAVTILIRRLRALERASGLPPEAEYWIPPTINDATMISPTPFDKNRIMPKVASKIAECEDWQNFSLDVFPDRQSVPLQPKFIAVCTKLSLLPQA